MPLLGRKPLAKAPPPAGLRDEDKVFYLEETREMFTDYEKYFERRIMMNSTVWTCSLTNRRNLTFDEARQSERDARKCLKEFNEQIKTPIIFLLTLTKRTSVNELLDDLFQFLSVRFAKNEIVLALNPKISKRHYNECRILDAIGPTGNATSPIDPPNIKYCVKKIDGDQLEWTATADQVHRAKSMLTRDKLKLFISQCVESSKGDGGLLVVKNDIIQKYLTEKKISKFNDLFIGKVPNFGTSKLLEKKQQQQQTNKKQKPGAINNDKKQAPISKFFAKNGTNQVAEENDADKERIKQQKLEKAKAMAEEMHRLKELKRQRKLAEEEFLAFADTKIKLMNQVQEDLQLQDHKPFPVLKPLSTLIPLRYIGDALMVQEFIYSFSTVLEDKDKFPNHINLKLMERALMCREVAGPLSDIVQVLLGSIFSLQIQENDNCSIEYADYKVLRENTMAEKHIKMATRAAKWSKLYLAMSINELPMDATTISELLRIHLLMSGARLDDNSEAARFAQPDDPGLILRIQQPHIIRALSMYTIYQLPIQDILTVLKCLIAQILTFSSIRDVVEERIEKATRAKYNLRNLCAAERRRENSVLTQKKTWQNDVRTKLNEFTGTLRSKELLQKELETELENKIKKLDDAAEREKNAFTKTYAELQQSIFAYQLYLGSDRAYRSYWLFESLPGLFIEQEPFSGKCKEVPIQNIPRLADAKANERKKCITQLLREQQKLNNKENAENAIQPKNGLSDPMAPILCKDVSNDLSASDLLICTANQFGPCPVHSTIDPNRTTWSFIHTADELNALIDALNIRGIREKSLRDQLESEKTLILNHIENCPAELLQIPNHEKDEKIKQLLEMKHYENANLMLPVDADLNLVMEQSLVSNLLEFESEIFVGHLGLLKVNDRDKWRETLECLNYDMQADYIEWGPGGQFHKGNKKLNGNTVPAENQLKYVDPGDELGNTQEITEDDTMDDLISLHDSPELKGKVQNYAAALLQIANAIDRKFFKEPFGANKDYKNKKIIQELMETGHRNLEMWSISLMNSQSFSAVYLHYHILHDSVKWSKSSFNATCIFCRRKSDPDKMILCDGCNCGKHLFCFKPKLTSVPEGDWFCEKCKPPIVEPMKTRKRQAIKEISDGDDDDDEDDALDDFINNDTDNDDDDNAEDDDNDDNDNEENDDDDDDIDETIDMESNNSESDSNTSSMECAVCSKIGQNLVKCINCELSYHLKCTKPPLKMQPDSDSWTCKRCKDKQIRREKQTRPHRDRAHDSNLNNMDIDDSDNVNNSSMRSKRRRIVKEMESDSNSDNECLAIYKKNVQINGFDTDSDLTDDEPVAKKSKHKATPIISDSENDEDFDFDVRKKTHKKKNGINGNAAASKKSARIETNQGKRARENGRHKRVSLRLNIDNLSPTLNTNASPTSSSGRSRRNNDDLLLDNVSLYNLLDDINKHKNAWPFLRPVSKSDVPDYYDVIQNPMDFAKIKSKLNMGSYMSNYEFMNDIQLIFSNCDLYNTNTSVIYKAGASLERFVRKRSAELNLPFKASDMLVDG